LIKWVVARSKACLRGARFEPAARHPSVVVGGERAAAADGKGAHFAA
jgi:hypothetical protein